MFGAIVPSILIRGWKQTNLSNELKIQATKVAVCSVIGLTTGMFFGYCSKEIVAIPITIALTAIIPIADPFFRVIKIDEQDTALFFETMKKTGLLTDRRIKANDPQIGETCPICKDDFKIGDFILVHNTMNHINHPAHEDCLAQWARAFANPTCPTCSQPLKRSINTIFRPRN